MQIQSALYTSVARLLHTRSKEEAERRERLNELKRNLDSAKKSLSNAMTNFDNIDDPQLVDMYIYRIQSERARYDHILREIKAFGN